MDRINNGWKWPNIWNWEQTLTPGVESSHELILPELASGTYQLHIMSAILYKSTGTAGVLESYGKAINPYQGSPSVSGGQEIGYWERPLMISTKPIYAGECDKAKYTISSEGCPEDYTCQKSSNLCVRTDILENNLACQTIGCPVNEEKTYLCASNGICTENVQQFTGCKSDSDCSPELTCDVPSQTCIRVERVECEKSSDCVVPCTAVSISCEESKCVYNPPLPGGCENVDEGHKDCNSEGCDSGYTCNKDTGVCYTTTVNTEPTGVDGIPANPYETTTTGKVVPQEEKGSWWKTTYWYYLAGILAVMGMIYYFATKDK